MKKDKHYYILTLLIILFTTGLFLTGYSDDSSGFDPDRGLIHSYIFGGNANDMGSDPKDGTISGAVFVTDRNGLAGNALSFDGDDYVTLEYYSMPSPCTISIWINTSDATGYLLYWKGPSGPGQDREQFTVSGSMLSHAMTDGLVADSVTGTVSVATGEWVNVVLVRDGYISTLYVNGTADTSDEVTVTVVTETLTIGEGFIGIIDEIRIYDYALSASEVMGLSEL